MKKVTVEEIYDVKDAIRFAKEHMALTDAEAYSATGEDLVCEIVWSVWDEDIVSDMCVDTLSMDDIDYYYSPATYWDPPEYEFEHPDIYDAMAAAHDEIVRFICNEIELDSASDAAKRLRKAISHFIEENWEDFAPYTDDQWDKRVFDWMETQSGMYYDD